MIQISHLTKKYGDHVAVSDLTLHMEPGKIYGFLGPNGAGKSTTMNVITGYIGAEEGTVEIHGFDILKQPEEARKCVGYLPELPPLYMEMTVAEYLTFAAELKKLPKEKKRQYIAEVMELTKITDMKNRLIRNLSKGYRQRVGLAQAVLGYPPVIILDEPTVGLDPQQIIDIRELIKSLGRRHTVILSSHILTEVKEVCEHIFILSKGRLAASDTTENLLRRMSKEQEVSLLLKGEQETVTHVLQQIEGIGSLSVATEGEAGCVRASLQAEKGADLRETLFFAFADERIPILEMQAGSKSLEQVFLELTAADKDTQETEAESETIKAQETEAESETIKAQETESERTKAEKTIAQETKEEKGQETAKEDVLLQENHTGGDL
ncbi:MAG: ATP-binding cassette domain-containing protein [Eubacterium sp.]|nr:ATP-binding cassette domain-containing protein [Eubacterium sp.]